MYRETYQDAKSGKSLKLEIRETAEEHIGDLRRLWANGDVMKFVGFPNGLQCSSEEMRDWHASIRATRPRVNHFSIFLNDHYIGETYYNIDTQHGNLASLDIKLLSQARGKGVAGRALSFAIDQAFKNGAVKVYVDPVKENRKAIALYERLGFAVAQPPKHLTELPYPLGIYMEKGK